MSKYSSLPVVKKPNVFIAIPMSKNAVLHAETARYCAVLNQHPDVVWGFVNGISAEYSRNTLIEYHFHNDPCWTHIYFLDSDVVPPPDALTHLLRLGADVAVGLTPIVADDRLVWNIQYKEGDAWTGLSEQIPDEPFDIYSSGAGCMLVRREVLVKIGYPWFRTEYQEIFKNEGKGIKIGEDVYFIKKAIEKGFRVIAHPKVKCKHFNTVDLLDIYDKCRNDIREEKQLENYHRQSLCGDTDGTESGADRECNKVVAGSGV